jgi:uncharacterized protein YukE
MTPESPTRVQVASGDPGALMQAAGWHDDLADGLAGHASTIAGSAASLSPAWNGEAAASYQTLSTLVANHFHAAATTSRSAANSLRRYAQELERLQREGTQALHEAEHWLDQVHTWTTRLHDADTAVRTASTQVSQAEGELRTAASMDAKGVALAAAAAARLRTAQDALHKAQGDQRRAQHGLDDANHQLTHWQRRGEQLWHDAQDAAMHATGELAPLSIPAPPLAGAPVNPSSLTSMFPSNPVDLSLFGLSGWSSYKHVWAEKAADDIRHEQRLNRSRIAEQRILADDPDLPEAARTAAGDEASRLGAVNRSLTGGLSDAERWAHYTNRLVGPAAGLLDTVSHLEDGDNPVKAAGSGIAATVGGYAGEAAGAGACDSTGVLAPVSPLCGAVGGAVGGWLGDKVGDLIP